MYGKIVRVGVKYYIVPLLQDQGGGLDLASTGSQSCPASVVQDDAYWWGNTMQFYPVDPKKGVVREWSDLNIEFPDAYTGCPENNVWTIVGDLSVYDDSHYITAGGEKGNPGSQTLNNWFKIVKTTNAYKLMSCPDVCYYCSDYCRDVGISVEAGQRRLVKPTTLILEKWYNIVLDTSSDNLAAGIKHLCFYNLKKQDGEEEERKEEEWCLHCGDWFMEMSSALAVVPATASAAASSSANLPPQPPLSPQPLTSRPLQHSFVDARPTRFDLHHRDQRRLHRYGPEDTDLEPTLLRILFLKHLQMPKLLGTTTQDLSVHFYFILQEREKYKLGNPKSFHYLNQSNCYELDGVNDGEEYLATRRAMDIVGISEERQVRSHEGPDAREKRPGLGGMDAGYTIDHVVESGKFKAPHYPQF
nr:kunitz trypsin inhibitor 2-like [Ipomoea batatas]